MVYVSGEKWIFLCWILASFLLHRWNDDENVEEGFFLDFVAGSWSGASQLVSLMSLVFAIQTKEMSETAYMDV